MDKRLINNGPKKINFSGPKEIAFRTRDVVLKKENSLPADDVNQVNNIKMDIEKGNILALDTSAIIGAPEVIDTARENGNLIVICWTVLTELDHLKDKPVVGFDAREAIRLIKKAIDNNDQNLVIETSQNYSGTILDRNTPDHQIIACVNFILKKSKSKGSKYYGYKKIKFLTNDSMVQIWSKVIFNDNSVIVEPLLKNRVEKIEKPTIRTIKLRADEIKKGNYLFVADKASYRLRENEYVIFNSDFDLLKKEKTDEFKPRFLGIKNGKEIILVGPDISVSKHGPLSNGKTNWSQVGAMHALKNQNIPAVILHGKAGAGKTFLALAAAFELRESGKFKNIVVGRATEPLDKNQQIGFIPGGIEAKMAPWTLPIVQNISSIFPKKICKLDKGYDERNISILEEMKVYVQPLDYIMGTTFTDTIIIIEEAENLSRFQLKEILTRVGKNTRIFITGDISQINHSNFSDKRSSGLAGMMESLKGQSLVAIINLHEVVRSPFASLVEKLM